MSRWLEEVIGSLAHQFMAITRFLTVTITKMVNLTIKQVSFFLLLFSSAKISFWSLCVVYITDGGPVFSPSSQFEILVRSWDD